MVYSSFGAVFCHECWQNWYSSSSSPVPSLPILLCMSRLDLDAVCLFTSLMPSSYFLSWFHLMVFTTGIKEESMSSIPPVLSLLDNENYMAWQNHHYWWFTMSWVIVRDWNYSWKKTKMAGSCGKNELQLNSKTGVILWTLLKKEP